MLQVTENREVKEYKIQKLDRDGNVVTVARTKFNGVVAFFCKNYPGGKNLSVKPVYKSEVTK